MLIFGEKKMNGGIWRLALSGGNREKTKVQK